MREGSPRQRPPPEYKITPAILSSLQQGDNHTWSDFYRRNEHAWKAYLGRRGTADFDADDVISETVAKIYTSVTTGDFRGNPISFAWRVLRNTHIDTLRSRVRTRNRMISVEPQDDIFVNRGPETAETDVEAEIHHYRALFQRGFPNVNGRYQRTLLEEAQGVPAEQVAREQNMNVPTVAVLRHRARAAVAKAARTPQPAALTG